MIKLFTSGMSHEQAVRWFKEQGKVAYDGRVKDYRQLSYVNSKARTATGVSADKRKKQIAVDEWYKQGGCGLNAWRL